MIAKADTHAKTYCRARLFSISKQYAAGKCREMLDKHINSK